MMSHDRDSFHEGKLSTTSTCVATNSRLSRSLTKRVKSSTVFVDSPAPQLDVSLLSSAIGDLGSSTRHEATSSPSHGPSDTMVRHLHVVSSIGHLLRTPLQPRSQAARDLLPTQSRRCLCSLGGHFRRSKLLSF
ncbi:hypothetical protein DOTSEDRAFT_75075 [Dothistroma septosporum NZE10]|uniref:Uncharacterized protein n=1 Tax=Dothistroma septosporum (strain NZE10 / CBS 128990) TaxID=675120 RepID=M2WJT5_DOTSN|nr:hypothetical protein DOTSEDRAFT_75075 [Dothistroma septosporum NZE10]